MSKYFMDLKKCWGGGGYAQIFYGLEKMLGVENVWGYANKFCVWILKKNWGGVVMPKYFIDLKKCLGGGGMQPYAKTF